MFRTIEEQLIRWKDSDRRKPLLVRGARQVGKSHAVTKFGREQFAQPVVLDLEKTAKFRRIFDGDLDTKRIVGDIEFAAGTRIEPGKTLLFLDEIQACPRAITALRYFYEDAPALHVAAAGSLLELALGESSFPVGRIQTIEMHPMSFAEFELALGNEKAAEVLQSPPCEVSETAHSALIEDLKTYCRVGGMPESVADYAEHRSLGRCTEILDELAATFRDDFPKYSAKASVGRLEGVFESIPRFVGRQLKYSNLAGIGTGPTVKKTFELLEKARLLTRVRASGAGGFPLGSGASSARFKAIMVDVGLWQRLLGVPLDREINEGDLADVHRGALAEQVVGQEMLAAGAGELFYWSREARGSQAETDYLAPIGGDIYGIEVKSGPAGRLRSLHLLLAEHKNVKGGLVFSSRSYEELPEQKLTFLPVYFAYSATIGPRVPAR